VSEVSEESNPEKRRPRGYAYQALCAAAAFAVSNLRRIASFLKDQYDRSTSSDKPNKHSSSRAAGPDEEPASQEPNIP